MDIREMTTLIRDFYKAGYREEEIVKRLESFDEAFPKDLYATEEGQLCILTLLQLGMAERTLKGKIGHNVFSNLLDLGLIEKREKKMCLTMLGIKKLLEHEGGTHA
jgi:hypothetical protein